MSTGPKPKASITPKPDGPYVIRSLEDLSNKRGPIETKPTIALCRCGGSANKPFCDGTHARIAFSSARLEGRLPDTREDYQGEDITIHDNRSICAHAGRCTNGLPSVTATSKSLGSTRRRRLLTKSSRPFASARPER